MPDAAQLKEFLLGIEKEELYIVPRAFSGSYIVTA